MIQRLINAQDTTEKINELVDTVNEILSILSEIKPSVDENSIYVNWPKNVEIPKEED